MLTISIRLRRRRHIGNSLLESVGPHSPPGKAGYGSTQWAVRYRSQQHRLRYPPFGVSTNDGVLNELSIMPSVPAGVDRHGQVMSPVMKNTL
jgi:hypothetical protein